MRTTCRISICYLEFSQIQWGLHVGLVFIQSPFSTLAVHFYVWTEPQAIFLAVWSRFGSIGKPSPWTFIKHCYLITAVESNPLSSSPVRMSGFSQFFPGSNPGNGFLYFFNKFRSVLIFGHCSFLVYCSAMFVWMWIPWIAGLFFNC